MLGEGAVLGDGRTKKEGVRGPRTRGCAEGEVDLLLEEEKEGLGETWVGEAEGMELFAD